MEKKNPSSDLTKALEEAANDDDWVDVSDAISKGFFKDPAIAITGIDLSQMDQIIMCKICQVSFSGITPYEQHLHGSKHKKKVIKDAMKKKYGQKYLEALKNQESGSEPLEEAKNTAGESDDDTVFTCEVCNKICTGIINYKLHINGKQHKKQVNKKNVIQKLQEDPKIDLDDKTHGLEDSVYDTMPQVKPFGHCDICKKKFSGPQALQDHLASGSHQKRLDMQNLTEKLIAKEQPTGAGDSGPPANPDPDSFGDGDFFAQCKVCVKNFSGPIPYQQHLISDAHEKKLKKVKLTEKMKSLSTNDEEVDNFHCKDCDRSFCIPEEFEQHLKSSSHTKRKIKQQMVEKLQNEYPEVEVQQMGATENDLPSEIPLPEDGTVLMCNVCHKSFTGPVSAQAHFTSVKHVKAKKQHLLLINYRKQENKNENM